MRLTEVISLVRARRRDGQDENTCLSMSDKRSSENNEQLPETTASDVIEHLKKILKEVVHKQEALEKALKVVKEYCEKDPSEIIESLSSVSSS